MTNKKLTHWKTRCIEAVKIMIIEYEKGDHSATKSHCSLCILYNNTGSVNVKKNCSGCPNIIFRKLLKNKTRVACKGRKVSASTSFTINSEAQLFWELALSVLQDLPGKCFNPKTSKPDDFKSLLIVDNDIHTKAITPKHFLEADKSDDTII